MYTDHPECDLPERTTKIWRYMNLTKLLSLLDNERLYFARVHQMDDPFEGSMPMANAEKQLMSYYGTTAYSGKSYRRRIRECTALSCWHMNEHESDAMWKLYLSSHEGVAIQSTVDRLIKSLASTEQEIYISTVRYIDFDREEIPERKGIVNTLNPFLYKRISFAHERELRAIIQDIPMKKAGSSTVEDYDFETPPFSEGTALSVDCDSLIENVYVSPAAPGWVSDVVQAVLDRWEVKRTVQQSTLLKEPWYDHTGLASDSMIDWA